MKYSRSGDFKPYETNKRDQTQVVADLREQIKEFEQSGKKPELIPQGVSGDKFTGFRAQQLVRRKGLKAYQKKTRN